MTDNRVNSSDASEKSSASDIKRPERRFALNFNNKTNTSVGNPGPGSSNSARFGKNIAQNRGRPVTVDDGGALANAQG